MHGSWGAGKRAGRLTKHGIDMDGGNEAPEAVTEDVAAHSTRVLLSTATQRQLAEHRAPRRELLCEPDSSFHEARTGPVVVKIYSCSSAQQRWQQ